MCWRGPAASVRHVRFRVVRGHFQALAFAMATPEEKDDASKTPVTIVTGFLGSGKTTLVNYILNGQHGKKIAVIENEFGEVNIDEALVTENMQFKEDVISMDNGCAAHADGWEARDLSTARPTSCVCCTVRGDLIKALTTLMKREKTFDHVLIETTGLADPAPVAFVRTLFRNALETRPHGGSAAQRPPRVSQHGSAAAASWLTAVVAARL